MKAKRQMASGRLVTRHQVRDGLQEMILSGERPPKTKLVQQELAKRFGVAQGVVREALLELQAYGLVESIDNRGVFVSELNAKILLDALGVREIHEGLAARLCCERTTRTDLGQLRDMVHQMHSLGKQGELMESAMLDREFHHTLVRLSGNSMLIRLADNYRILGKVIQLSRRDCSEVRDEHLEVLDAIENGDGEEAERLMRKHIRFLKQAVERQIDSGEFVPRWLSGDHQDVPAKGTGATGS